MHLFVTVPHEGYLRSEIDDFVAAATALLSANGGSLTYRKIEDRPTMACRNRQAAEFLASPCDTFLTLDADCLPTRDGQPDMDGLRHLLDAIARPEVDIVSGWTLMLRETHGDMIPNIAGPPEPEPGRPYLRSSDIVTPYLEEPLVEITGGGVGAHTFVALARFHREPRTDVGFSGPAVADRDDVRRRLYVGAGRQLVEKVHRNRLG